MYVGSVSSSLHDEIRALTVTEGLLIPQPQLSVRIQNTQYVKGVGLFPAQRSVQLVAWEDAKSGVR